ncbi:hypothetical protein GPNCGGLF_LOCUS1354 [Methylorubrum aminovorans]
MNLAFDKASLFAGPRQSPGIPSGRCPDTPPKG